ncbi:MAG: alanine--tRNA ligase [Candidatus Yonathbacteria bacterium]|nr:alanine--tRNA ligase [Candidatus Yonathbacteria bacterium]
MQSEEIRKKFLEFFEKRGHAIIPSSSLVPENDPSVLFTTAGMQPLVPYLLGAPHPKGKRLANSQKCVRTQDIDEVGDNTHDTFFEMLGNWSLGDYFKEDTIKWSYEFLTSKEGGLGLDPKRLYVTVFEGNNDAPRDTEAFEIWKRYLSENRIYFMPAKSNWWSAGDSGPCGPDTEMFYDVTEKGLGDLTKEEYIVADERQDVVEIWNDVFMEYEKKVGKVVGKLKNKNVDTGAGLERLCMVMQKTNNVFDTDLFKPIMGKINDLAPYGDGRLKRIIADHVRTSVFMIADGVFPSNTDRGYVLRRLLRRAVRYVHALDINKPGILADIALPVIEKYQSIYPEVKINEDKIKKQIEDEETLFDQTLAQGLRELTKIRNSGNPLSGKEAFKLFSTYGFPIELTKEFITVVGEYGFWEEMKKHQELSRAGAEQKFKGGLADTSEKTTMLHTSTHLMLAGLRKYLGGHVHQAGSNITQERTRFDFTHPEKVSPEILKKVEDYVNEAIAKECTVVIEQIPKDEAQKAGVEGSFWEKYPDTVNVYMVKASDGTIYSRELCGGPHVKNTSQIGHFKIIKEEAVAAGVRRIKAVVG